MPKIVFIEPKAPNLHIFSQFPLPRLGTLILGTMMKERGWDGRGLRRGPPARSTYDVIASADLVGISTITSTAPRAYAIADRVRAMGNPRPHGRAPRDLPDRRGPGARRLRHPGRRGGGAGRLHRCPGARRRTTPTSPICPSGTTTGAIVHNPLAPRASDLDRIPFPDFSLLRPEAKGAQAHVVDPRPDVAGLSLRLLVLFGDRHVRPEIPLSLDGEHHRGAPRLRRAEVAHLLLRRQFRRRPAAHHASFCEAMIREGLKLKWTTQVRADVTRDLDLVRLMKKAGCHTVYIGFESVNPEALDRHEEEADRGRDRPGGQDLPPQPHPHPRHVRPRLRRGRLEDDPQDGPLRQAGPPDLDPVPHPDAPARLGLLRPDEGREAPALRRLGPLRRPPRRLPAGPLLAARPPEGPDASPTASSIRSSRRPASSSPASGSPWPSPITPGSSTGPGRSATGRSSGSSTCSSPGRAPGPGCPSTTARTSASSKGRTVYFPVRIY